VTGRAGSYRSYLCLDQLLSLQVPLTPAADIGTRTAEHFFIVCHQASELCAAQVFLDLAGAARTAQVGDWATASASTTRAAALVRLARSQLTALLYLPVADFHRFRDILTGASGAESEQFTALLRISAHPDVQAVQRRLPAALPASGAHREGTCRHDACATDRALRALIAGAAAWRRRHAQIARHFIGDLPGTGGTSGVSYLLREEGAAGAARGPADEGGNASRVTSAISSRRHAVR
jgi:tryptophan 2,3-dioxygenase